MGSSSRVAAPVEPRFVFFDLVVQLPSGRYLGSHSDSSTQVASAASPVPAMSSYADEAKAPGEKQDAKQNSKQSIAAECHGCSTSQQMRVGKPARCTGQAESRGVGTPLVILICSIHGRRHNLRLNCTFLLQIAAPSLCPERPVERGGALVDLTLEYQLLLPACQ